MGQKPEVKVLSHEGWTSPSRSFWPALAWYVGSVVLHFIYYMRQPLNGGDVFAAALIAILLGSFAFVGYFATVEIVKWDKERSSFWTHAMVPLVTAGLEIACLVVVPILFAFVAKALGA